MPHCVNILEVRAHTHTHTVTQQNWYQLCCHGNEAAVGPRSTRRVCVYKGFPGKVIEFLSTLGKITRRKWHHAYLTSCDQLYHIAAHSSVYSLKFRIVRDFEFKNLKKEKLLLYLMTFGKVHKFHRTKGSLVLDCTNKPHSFIHAESSDVKSLRQRHEGSWGEETTPYRLHRNVTGYFCGEINSCFDMISLPSVPPPACESSPLRAEAWIIKHIKIHYWFRIC